MWGNAFFYKFLLPHTNRSSGSRVFFKRGFFKSFVKFTGKPLRRKRLRHKCFLWVLRIIKTNLFVLKGVRILVFCMFISTMTVQLQFQNSKMKLQACNFFKKRLRHKFFPVNIAKILRTLILKNICERLLLTFLAHCHFVTIPHFLYKWIILKKFKTSLEACIL